MWYQSPRIRRGAWNSTNRPLARLIEVGQDTALFHLIIGKAHLAHQEYSRAFDELQHAARIDPKLPFVHYFLGTLYRRRNDFEAAKQEFLKDASIEPDVPYDYDQLGAACYALDQISDAERIGPLEVVVEGAGRPGSALPSKVRHRPGYGLGYPAGAPRHTSTR